VLEGQIKKTHTHTNSANIEVLVQKNIIHLKSELKLHDVSVSVEIMFHSNSLPSRSISLSVCGVCCVHVGWPHVVSRRTSLDLSRTDGADDFFDVSSTFPTGRKRNMSWLLAAVMSVCEEDPRKCRVSARGRPRIRGSSSYTAILSSWMQTLAQCRLRCWSGLSTIAVATQRLALSSTVGWETASLQVVT